MIKSRGVDTIYFWRACAICTAANFNLRNGKRFCPAGPFDLFAHGHLLPLLELHKRLSATFPEEREGERERERERDLSDLRLNGYTRDNGDILIPIKLRMYSGSDSKVNKW